MTLKISDLVQGSIFKHNGTTYIIGGSMWNSSRQKEYLGTQGENLSLRECHPKLGGQFQIKIRIWFSEETEVNVEND
jgi:hypothetical protein